MRRRNPNDGLVVFWVKLRQRKYSRYRYVEAFEEHSSYSSAIFLEHMLKAFKFPVECVQTDNGAEFTKRLCPGKATPTMFENQLKKHGIEQLRLIYPALSNSFNAVPILSTPSLHIAASPLVV